MAKLLRVLGHPARLAMIEELKKRSWCVCELAAKLGLNNPTASKHLSLLNSVGVIEMEKEGTQVNCRLVMPCVFDMMHCTDQNNAKNNLYPYTIESLDKEAAGKYCNTNCCKIEKKNS